MNYKASASIWSNKPMHIIKIKNFMSRKVLHATAKCPDSKQQKSCKDTFTVHLYNTFKDYLNHVKSHRKQGWQDKQQQQWQEKTQIVISL